MRLDENAPGDPLPQRRFSTHAEFLDALSPQQRERLRWTMQRQGLKTTEHVWSLFFRKQ
jgi:hypothetical protein